MFSKKEFLKFKSLPFSDQWLLIQAAFWLIFIQFGLIAIRFKTLRRITSRISQLGNKKLGTDQVPLGDIIWAVETASKHLPGEITCLPQGLTAQMMLNQSGYDAELQIGARKGDQGKIQAHAWVECQGYVVIGYLENLSTFCPLNPTEVKSL